MEKYYSDILIILCLGVGFSINSTAQDKTSPLHSSLNTIQVHETLSVYPTHKYETKYDTKTVTCENVQDPKYQAVLLDLINDIRNQPQQCGKITFPATHALAWNDQLYTSAYSHARDLAQRQMISHLGKHGENLKTRMKLIGYIGGGGENIASGQNTLSEVLSDWTQLSPAHCKNMVQETFKHYAIACVRNPQTHRPYWVQHFGSGKNK